MQLRPATKYWPGLTCSTNYIDGFETENCLATSNRTTDHPSSGPIDFESGSGTGLVGPLPGKAAPGTTDLTSSLPGNANMYADPPVSS